MSVVRVSPPVSVLAGLSCGCRLFKLSRCVFVMTCTLCLLCLLVLCLRVRFEECGGVPTGSIGALVGTMGKMAGVVPLPLATALLDRPFPVGPSPIELEEQPLPSWWRATPSE